ncbi:MAG TPA: sigma-70 family RNA polymerase sigma factor [Blastocatellia bacterium]|nr:sigma-70 family RNA polymerase sigma factor [Blastocatellia bacterium]
MNNETSLVELVRRIIARDPRAEEELVLRYKDGVYQIIYQVTRNQPVTEDLCQETLMKALEKVRHGDVREPERLSGFICQMAKFIAIDYVRKMRAAMRIEEIGAAEQVPDPSPDPSKQVLDKENAEAVRKVLSEMKVQRDKDILFRYYILEEEKDKICADLKLSRDQFSRVIFRALQRYKELHLKLEGKT